MYVKITPVRGSSGNCAKWYPKGVKCSSSSNALSVRSKSKDKSIAFMFGGDITLSKNVLAFPNCRSFICKITSSKRVLSISGNGKHSNVFSLAFEYKW